MDMPSVINQQPPSRQLIFLSYAREDDEPFVKRIHDDLSARGFEVWWDRVSMPSRALTFLHEIRDAIERCDRVLLVIGPKSVASDYVIAEWRHSITFGKTVNPILRLGEYALVPEELRLLHVEDFRLDLDYDFHLGNLLRQLADRPKPMGKLTGVSSLPAHLVTRAEVLLRLKEAVLADLIRPVVVTDAAARVGLHGMGGIGKSVLTNLLVRDPAVRRAFPDGVIWVSVGPAPNLPELLRNAEPLVSGATLDQAADERARLEAALADKAVLLVLDNVWKREHAEAFNVLGLRCRMIITTRDSGLAGSFAGTHYPVDFFSQDRLLDLAF